MFSGCDLIYNKIRQTFAYVLGKPYPKMIVFGFQGVGKTTLLNSVAGSIIFQSGPSSRGLTKKVKEITVGNTTYCDTPGFNYKRNEKRRRKEEERKWGKAISKLLHEGGTCKIVFVVQLRTAEAGGWIKLEDTATMRLILDAAPEIGKRFGVIVNCCPEKQIKTLSNSERFAKNIFYGMKRKQHHESIHFIKNDPDLKDNGLIKTSEIEDLNEFLDDKVPYIDITKNRSKDVNVEKWQGNT